MTPPGGPMSLERKGSGTGVSVGTTRERRVHAVVS